MTHPTLSNAELERRWRERIQSGTFSPAVCGLGTIRVMGKTGDAPLQFPRIQSLDALSELEPDEQWAVRVALALVSQATKQSRAVFAVQPGALSGTPVQTFDPMVESLMVVSRVAGG